jgi:hypothetical protein
MLKAIRRPNASADKLEPLIPISQTRQKLVFAKHLILEGRDSHCQFLEKLAMAQTPHVHTLGASTLAEKRRPRPVRQI